MLKRNSKKKIKIDGGFWKDIENLSLFVPSLKKIKGLRRYKLNKKKSKKKQKGGFIRSGSTQHFYSKNK